MSGASGAIQTVININQKNIKNGTSYQWAYDRHLTEGGILGIRFKSGANRKFHFNMNIFTQVDILFNMFKDTTFTNIGTALTAQNLDFGSVNTTEQLLSWNPVASVEGTKVIPSPGAGVSIGLYFKAGQVNLCSTEMISALDTEYYIQLESGGLGEVGFVFFGYER